MRTTVWLLASCVLCLGAGCTALVEGTLSGRGGNGGLDAGMHDTGPTPDTGPMIDSGPASPCSGQADGVRCEVMGLLDPFVCIGGVCQLSRCGDGARDDRSGSMHTPEECDDGNDADGDGCDNDCTFSCHQNTDCVDMESCNGVETCDTATTHTCQPGMDEPDTTACTIASSGTAAVCHAGTCRAGMCGDGVLDEGEQCDDHNANDGDGCDADCTYSCVADSDCSDGDLCNGNELCDVMPDGTGTHTCGPAAAGLTCDDMDMCTTDSCDATMGCVFASRLVDMDGDGYNAPLAGCGGDDCDDTDPARYPGAPEVCGGGIDSNCDGMVGAPPVWYRDCDGDSYAAAGATPTSSCTMPATTSSCVSWTQRVPATAHVSIDCLDTSVGGSVHPNELTYFTTTVSGLSPAYDYDCSGTAVHQWPVFDTTTSPNPPSPLPRGFVTCHIAGTLIEACVGDSFWRQSTLPACGASGTQAYCTWVTNFITGVRSCQYANRTVAAACR